MPLDLSLRRTLGFAALVTGLATALSPAAAIAGGVEAAMAYDISHSIPTNVAGVTAFPEAPAGFDVVNASPQARAVYGFPPAPDPVADPHGYTQWSRAMSAASRAKRYNGPLRAVDLRSMPMAANERYAKDCHGVKK